MNEVARSFQRPHNSKSICSAFRTNNAPNNILKGRNKAAEFFGNQLRPYTRNNSSNSVVFRIMGENNLRQSDRGRIDVMTVESDYGRE